MDPVSVEGMVHNESEALKREMQTVQEAVKYCHAEMMAESAVSRAADTGFIVSYYIFICTLIVAGQLYSISIPLCSTSYSLRYSVIFAFCTMTIFLDAIHLVSILSDA